VNGLTIEERLARLESLMTRVEATQARTNELLAKLLLRERKVRQVVVVAEIRPIRLTSKNAAKVLGIH
jgi:hypothetical protein